MHPCPWRHAYWIQLRLLFLEFFVCFYVSIVYVFKKKYFFYLLVCRVFSFPVFCGEQRTIFSCLQFCCSCTCFSSTYHHSWNMNFTVLLQKKLCTKLYVNPWGSWNRSFHLYFCWKEWNTEKQQHTLKITFFSMVL